MLERNRRLLRCLLAAAVLLACGAAARRAFRAGISRLMAETAPRLSANVYGAEALGLAEQAVDLSSSDPEAHDALAVALARRGELEAAVGELEHAASLRPRYYMPWLRLGRARSLAGDAQGALAAYQESVRLAPFYAEPHWQLGNLLLREGRPEEAFAELRRAVESRPSLAAYTAELAWRAYAGDARAVVRAVAPRTAEGRMALARFFAKRGREAEALEQYREGGREAGEVERRALISDLIATGKYRAAREVWAEGAGESGAGAGMSDGGFEIQTSLAGASFEWQFARELPAVKFSLDAAAPHGGARSLLLSFGGDTGASPRLVAQLVAVEPGARYRLWFAARTETLVSGARPVVAVLSASGDKVLAESESMPEETGGWREYELEFNAPGEAVLVVVRRPGCVGAACPVFGSVWFDDFSLGKVTSP